MASSDDGPAGERLSVRAFGPLEVACDDDTRGPADLGGSRPRQIFEILLSSRGHPVPKDRLVELLWNLDPPRDAVATLESHVSVLRRHLSMCGRRGSDVVTSVPGGYAIDREAIDLDLDVFDELLAAGAGAPREETLGLLERALSLVRGPVFEDEPTAPWAEQARAKYEDVVERLRLDAAEAALTERSYRTALDHAETVARSDPSNERACRLVMMAAYAGGDQERAVRAYVDTRSALSDDLGVEPLPETQSLYLAILRHESPTSLLPDDLRRTEPGFRRLADQQAAQGWWTTDPALNVTSVVGEPGRFIGVDRRQMEGRTAEDVSVRVGIPGIVSDHRRALAGEPVTREIAVGGQTYAVHLEPMRHGSEVVGVVGVSMDVTGREQAAAILEDETSTAGADRDDPEDRNGMDDDVEAVLQDLRDVLDRSSDALLVVDPWADLILAANEAAAELLGHQRDELMRRRPSDLHRGEMGAFLGFMERVDDEGFGWTDDLSCATGDGRLLRVAIASRRLTFHRRRAVLSLLRPIERGRERDPRLLAKLRVAGEG